VYDDVTVSFKLTRAADVDVTVARGGSTVRTLHLGRLGPGKQTVVWDGKGSDGATAPGGRYTIALAADGTLGATSAMQTVAVDLSAPKLIVPSSVRVARRKTAKISYTPKDPYSTMVKVGAMVTNSRGATVASLNLGWVKPGAVHVCAWRTRVRGAFTVTFKAVDLGGNRLAMPVVTKVKVR
jgi:hypothetical protein